MDVNEILVRFFSEMAARRPHHFAIGNTHLHDDRRLPLFQWFLLNSAWTDHTCTDLGLYN